METLTLEKTDTTPFVSFNLNEGLFTLEGECRPENVLTFFNPIMNWIRQAVDEIKKGNMESHILDFHFKLEYYNSSSAKFIFEMFKLIKEMQNQGADVTMFWFYDVLDEDLLECGQEYQKILKLPFKFVALQD